MIDVRMKCTAHPRYRAVRYPTVFCKACVYLWSIVHQGLVFYMNDYEASLKGSRL